MTSSQRIILNTLATYGRTVFAMALGLFSSRWILQSLGSVDYGLMSVVGGLIMFVTFLNGVTASSCARFFAYSIGRGDTPETNKWFNTALSIHTFLPAILILVGWPVGEWAIENFLNIPPERLKTAILVFRISLISAFWGMISTPYIGMFTAKQRIYEMSVWGILQTLLSFSLAYGLTQYKGDAWLLYSSGTVGIMLLLGFCQVLRARELFPECRVNFSLWWNWGCLSELFSFVGWQLFGGFGSILKGQGTAVLLNKYFSPSAYPDINAAYSLGNTVSSYTQTLSGALLGAFTPEITATEGRGERERMLRMADRASKFGTYLVLLLAIPLILEIDYVLNLWLVNPPKQAGLFCILILIQFLIDKLTYGHMVSVAAYGRIAGYQMMLGGVIILSLPLAWLFLWLGYPPISVVWAFLITTSMLSGGRVLWARYLIGASPWQWVVSVFTPVAGVGLFSALVGYGVRSLFTGPSFARLIAVCIVVSLTNLFLAWNVILDSMERRFVCDVLNKARVKLGCCG